MRRFKQLSFSDLEIHENRTVTRTEEKLRKIDQFVDFERIVDRFSVIDKTKKGLGGRPRKKILLMTRISFVQYLYNLSDPELEDQLNDRLSFKLFVGLGMNSKVPDYTTIWRFKEALVRHHLLDGLFQVIVDECDRQRPRYPTGYSGGNIHSLLFHSETRYGYRFGREVPSGFYIARLVTPEYSKSSKRPA